MNKQVSHGLDAIKEVYDALNIPIPWNLVVEVYEIERKYQFHENRQHSFEAVRELVNDFIKGELSQ